MQDLSKKYVFMQQQAVTKPTIKLTNKIDTSINSKKRESTTHRKLSEFDKARLFFKNGITYRVGQLFIIALAFFCMSLQAWGAGFADCPQNFYLQTPPDYIENKLFQDSSALCFNGFATLYSGVTRTPLWSAEHLTRERLYQAEQIPREDSFHSERRLPRRMRAHLSDYKGSDYDRGHLAPNADMATLEQQYDSFSLANIIPQSSKNNRYLWRNLESVTRYLTKKYGEVYVVTGVTFSGSRVIQLNDRVIVPTHVFKAIYIPKTQEAAAYFAPNDDTQRIQVISIDELALRSGIDVFPAIANDAKSKRISLPTTLEDIQDKDKKIQAEADSIPFWLQVIIEILRWIIESIKS